MPRPAGDVAAPAAARFAHHPALDGLRVVCVYVILAGGLGAINASNVAVDLLCVLSGFLVTTLLTAERTRTGTVSIGRFLLRRAVRLMPGMAFYLFVGLAVTVAFKWAETEYRDDYVSSAVSAFFNVNNWYKVAHPEAGGNWLSHVWLLSMEAQFYLLW
ncbi:acyltransferase family protein, partial [Frankia sp. EI5c]|uniref:acyltransferase family protein n=1 Tax=Frankia sp. EI5c TaxID=683316 RepID=UPI0037BF4F47